MKIPTVAPIEEATKKPPHVVVRGTARGFLQEVVSGKHHLRGDEPVSVGGDAAAPGRTTICLSHWASAHR